MKAFDIIYAKFMPKHEEACNPMLLEQVGKVMRWQASSKIYWGPQEGQWCFYAKDDLQLQPSHCVGRGSRNSGGTRIRLVRRCTEESWNFLDIVTGVRILAARQGFTMGFR